MNHEIPQEHLLASLLALLLLWLLLRWTRRRRSRDDLDRPLFYFTPKDPYSLRDLLAGGVAIYGVTSAAKTSASGKLLGESIIAYRNSSGLITAAKKGEDLLMWRRRFAKAGRRDDLLVFEPGGNLRLNFLDEISRQGGDAREITQFLTTIGESLRANSTRGGGEDQPFFAMKNEQMIYDTVVILKLAKGRVTVPDMQQFILTAAQCPDDLDDPAWQRGFHAECLQAAHSAKKSPIEAHDFGLAVDGWLGEFPRLADRTRSSVVAGVFGIMHPLSTGIVREMASTTSNISFAETLRRRWWMITDFPPADGPSSIVINVGLKYLAQRCVLGRVARPSDAIHVCWCDEAQRVVNSFDSQYVAECRSHKGCLVFLTQSVASFYAAMKGERGEYEARALLGNFGHRIFHASDLETAQYASSSLGSKLEMFPGGSVQPAQNLFDELMGFAPYSASFSSHYEPVLQTNAFLTGLRMGGPRNGYVADGIVIKSGRPFSNGQNWLKVAFRQR